MFQSPSNRYSFSITTIPDYADALSRGSDDRTSSVTTRVFADRPISPSLRIVPIEGSRSSEIPSPNCNDSMLSSGSYEYAKRSRPKPSPHFLLRVYDSVRLLHQMRTASDYHWHSRYDHECPSWQ